MKTLKSIFIALVLFTISSNAQITKGNWMVGGSGSFYSANFKDQNFDSKSIGLELRPNIGYFLADKFAVGISPLLGYNKPEGSTSVTSYGIGLYSRYYLLNTDRRVNILTHLGYSYFTSSNSMSKSTAVDLKAGPVVYFNSSVALEMTLNYNSNQQSSTTYNILSIGLGFQIHLEK